MSSATTETKQIGEYVIEQEIGRGAFGVVYRAHHKDRPETPLALKIVQGRGQTDRMLLEPAVLSRLNHPNIVRLEDYFLRNDDLVLVLEFIDGQDLKTLLEDGTRLSQSDVREMLVQLGRALAAAHDQRIVHRDIKPANILVTKTSDGFRYVLTDFGIGQVREGIQQQKQTGGTYLFMAPEQLRGRPSPQSDLWALGVVAFRLLTGRMPFPGPSIQELTNQILYGGVATPSEVLGKPIDPDLEKAVLHLLDKSLQERTGSASELLRELGCSTQAARSGPPTRTPSAGTFDEKLARGIARQRSLLALILFLYLVPITIVSGLLLIFGGFLFYLSQREARARRLDTVLLTAASFTLLFVMVQLKFGRLKGYDVGVVNLGAEIGPVAAVVGVVLAVLNIALPIAAGWVFATLRRLQREKLLRDLAREEGPGSDRYLQALQQALDSRFEDVGFHLKYAEALFARGKVKEAAAECRVLLVQDPYNFNGNLLLANAYYTLGLDAECAEQCDGYLAVSGYCFEFSELREQARRRSPA